MRRIGQKVAYLGHWFEVLQAAALLFSSACLCVFLWKTEQHKENREREIPSTGHNSQIWRKPGTKRSISASTWAVRGPRTWTIFCLCGPYSAFVGSSAWKQDWIQNSQDSNWSKQNGFESDCLTYSARALSLLDNFSTNVYPRGQRN